MPLQPSPFRERLVHFLLPYFLAVTSDIDEARAEVLETLASYGARTRSEMINAARIIAFSFSALDRLAEAAGTEMAASMRLRFSSCANNLNRSCQQNEQALAARLAIDVPDAAQPVAEPMDDMPEAEFEAALLQARIQIDAYRNGRSITCHTASPQAISASQQDRDGRLRGAGIVAALAASGMPVQPPAAH
jgi:hypothetical protein